MNPCCKQARVQHRGAFSLIELLIAIFILGIGIISIAAIFPAGISQQQRTADDIIGPIVAHNAMTLLRSRLEQDDFGLCKEFDTIWPGVWNDDLCDGFSQSDTNLNPWPTICGDWMWRRPAIFESDHSDFMLRGTIDIFGEADTSIDLIAEEWYSGPVPGIPYNREKYPNRFDEQNGDPAEEQPPVVRISAGERQYPMWQGDPRSENATLPIPFDLNDRPNASYYWDCMFRRYEGRILVAVFVYRVVTPGSTDTAGAYVLDTHDPYNPSSHLTNPDFPRHINLDWDDSPASTGAWNVWDNGDPYNPELLVATEDDNPLLPEHQWQYPGQWIVDQNGFIHKVQRGRRKENDPPVRLASAPYEIQVSADTLNPSQPAPSNVNWWTGPLDFSDPQQANAGFVFQGVVTDLWFLPTQDTMGRSIKPVFATVQEL